MKIVYWILMVLLNAGCGWCLWIGMVVAEGMDFLIIPLGAALAIVPSLTMLIWTTMRRCYLGLAGFVIPGVLILLGFIVIMK